MLNIKLILIIEKFGSYPPLIIPEVGHGIMLIHWRDGQSTSDAYNRLNYPIRFGNEGDVLVWLGCLIKLDNRGVLASIKIAESKYRRNMISTII